MKTFFASCFKSFTSRKFLVAVITAALLFFDKKLGLGLSLEEKAIAAGIGAFWILAESAIDFKAVKGFNLDKGIARLNQLMPIVQEVFKRLDVDGSKSVTDYIYAATKAPAPGTPDVGAAMPQEEFEKMMRDLGAVPPSGNATAVPNTQNPEPNTHAEEPPKQA